MKPLPALLTGREYARVARVTAARIGHDPNRSKAQYLAELEITARELYPAKLAAHRPPVPASAPAPRLAHRPPVSASAPTPRPER